jgi:ABC-type dipeptide/oligopeptide/nickel transport system ATPase component
VGQGQRLLIGLALLHRPKLVVADEPTSALDLITQQEVLRLLREISDRSGTAILYISHDLASVLQLCHRVAILLNGQIIEAGPTREVFCFPRHPYAQRLIGALPRVPAIGTSEDHVRSACP